MKTFLSTGLVLFVTFVGVRAQDPGFRVPESSRSARQSTGQSGNVNAGAAVLTSMDVLDNNRPISVGDTISIRILEDRQQPLQQIVAVTGEVQAPYVGLVGARGKTCRELAYTIKRELEKNFFKSATVVIAIDKINERDMINEIELDFYVVFGFVLRQGKYDLPTNEDVTISQAILRAGGFAQFANKKEVKIVRKTPQGNKNILVNVDAIMQQGDLDRDIYLRKDDVIIVKELNINF
ncbi:MAG: polysaccharide biosynthesis/export family protein [Verrucomicrobiaceae bacterium]